MEITGALAAEEGDATSQVTSEVELSDYPGIEGLKLDILHADTEELKKLFIMKVSH